MNNKINQYYQTQLVKVLPKFNALVLSCFYNFCQMTITGSCKDWPEYLFFLQVMFVSFNITY